MVDLLRASGELIGEPKTITHPVKFFEKGDKPLEIVSTRQWYITNGARDETLRATPARDAAASSPGTPTSCACATRTGSAASPATG